MTIYKKWKSKSIILCVVSMILLMWTNLSISAEESIKIYNRNEEVILSHEPVFYNEQYFIHFDDLDKLGLEVTKETADDPFDDSFVIWSGDIIWPSDDKSVELMGLYNVRYTITSRDYLGDEKKVIIDDPMSYGGSIIVSPETGELILDTPSIAEVTYSGSIGGRYTKTIGESNSSSINLDRVVGGQFGDLIKVNGDYYISTEIIGKKLSHKYSFENGRMDFYIANTDSVIMKTTVNASSKGNDVKIYTAYKTGAGNTLDDFEILSSKECTIPTGESKITCEIETPAEKISDKNIYFIVDLGERYDLIYEEYDFSAVGNVVVYAEQKDSTYTVNITLPEIEEVDVPFTVYVKTDKGVYSKQGVIKSGEEFCKFEFEGLPGSQDIKTWIKFDYHKYKNAVLEEFMRLKESTADFDTDFTPAHSKELVCNVNLPEDFVPEGDVEVRVTLSQYRHPNGMYVVDDLRDWSDSRTVILNNEKRSEQVTLYWQSSPVELSYGIRSGGKGLYKSASLGINGKATSNDDFAKKIEEEMVVDLTLLRRKNITVNVLRPLSISLDNDIFAKVVLFDVSGSMGKGKTIDFTETPLIPSGERKAQLEFEIIEDKIYEFGVLDITGDDHLFDYCYHPSTFASPADKGNVGIINFTSTSLSNDTISLTLLTCNNVTGTIECADMDLGFEVVAICNLEQNSLYHPDPITLTAYANNGEFCIKVPKDTDTYTIGVQTGIGKKSYYVSDGVSTNSEDEATEISFEYEDDREILLEYIIQNPSLPIEISSNRRNEYFQFKNVSDYPIEAFDVYLSYYDKNGKVLSMKRIEKDRLAVGGSTTLYCDASDYRMKTVKAFAWKRGSLVPLGNSVEIAVNTLEPREKDMMVFNNGDVNAIINCEEVVLSEAPKVIDHVMYILPADLEKLGYKVEISGNERYVYIEDNEKKFRFTVGYYEARRVISDSTYERYEISAPVISDNGIKIPLNVICELFDEHFDWYSDEETFIINLPFADIGEFGKYTEAILDMYYRGVINGVVNEDYDRYFEPEHDVIRIEAAAIFTGAMGHSFSDYEFECDDIESTHWGKSFVGICINENVFELEDNKFRPYDRITVEETIVAALRMIGADYDNYLGTARDKGIMTNIDEENIERDITKAELVQILYNALNVKS